MQQLPPFPDDAPGFEPTEPGQPTEAPVESPGTQPPIDVPSPSSPGNDPSSTPISPVS